MAKISISDDAYNGLRGNKAIKAADQTVFTTVADAKYMINEINHCIDDIVYFAENYFTIISGVGKHIIKLYPKQKEFLKCLVDNDRVVCCASRQAAKTTTYTIYSLWYSLFHAEKTILIVANKFATAKEIMERIQLAYELLPAWLKLGCVEYNKSRIVFENDSKIQISSTSPSACRGVSADIVICDEFAFVDNNTVEAFVQSVFPIVSSRPASKIILVSTPNGMGNYYAETYHKALYSTGKEGWVAFRIDWWDIPGRDEAWKELKLAEFNYDYKKFAQEYGCLDYNTKIDLYDINKNEYIRMSIGELYEDLHKN